MINTENNINDMATELTNKILEISSETIPNKIITVRQNDLPWINNNIRKLIRKRDIIRRKAKKNKNKHTWAKFRAVRNKVVNVLRNAKAEYYKKLCDKLKENKFSSQNWWSLVKKISCITNQNNKDSIPVLVNDKN